MKSLMNVECMNGFSVISRFDGDENIAKWERITRLIHPLIRCVGLIYIWWVGYVYIAYGYIRINVIDWKRNKIIDAWTDGGVLSSHMEKW